jgi:hypothetical protein
MLILRLRNLLDKKNIKRRKLINWFNWNKICLQHEEAGVGVRRIRELNIFFIG